MLVTIIGIAIMVLPFLALAWEEGKLIREKEEWLKKEEAARKRVHTSINLQAIAHRWPFVSVPELYAFKKYTDPNFDKPYNAATLHELRIEHSKKIKSWIKGG